MSQRKHNTTKLPQHLLRELRIQGTNHFFPIGIFNDRRVDNAGILTRKPKLSQPGARKEIRKAARVEKRSKNGKHQIVRHRPVKPAQSESSTPLGSQPPIQKEEERRKQQSKPLKPILKKTVKIKPLNGPKSTLNFDQSPSPPPSLRLSKGAKDRLAEDDAEIAALERVLGMKDTKKLPKSFGDDGLDVLLEGLDSAPTAEDGVGSKRQRREEEEWLRAKRMKASTSNRKGVRQAELDNVRDNLEEQPPNRDSGNEDNGLVNYSDLGDSSENSAAIDSSEETSFEDFSDEQTSCQISQPRVRENPYIAPVTTLKTTASSKYVPPSKREASVDEAENSLRLRRQAQGLLNRLSEANLLSIVKEYEELYRVNPRQMVTSALIELLTGLLCDPMNLQDTFIILHAGFIAAMHRVIGSDFGAQMLTRIDDEITSFSQRVDREISTGKKTNNLVSLLAHLYNFKVVGCGLIFDYVRLFLGELSETHTELLLKILRGGAYSIA